MRESSERNKKLNFKGIFSILFILAIFIFFSTVALDGLNNYRASRLYKTYSEEALAYMEKNRTGLTQIFADMQNTQCAFTPCGSMAQDDIAHAISDDLQDFSSTAFIAINKSGELMLMRLSGERELLYSGEPTTLKMKELMNGTRSELPWDDYTYFYEGKEVLIPFKNSEGKIMGLLMRAAIAK